MKKRFALIGCGGIGQYHLDHLLQFDDIDLVGFCDIILDRAEDFAKQAGHDKAYGHYLELLDATDIDGVFLCVPPHEHGEIEFELIKRGIHFFVEKPVALDIELGKSIRDAAKAANIITAVGFQCRYSALVEPNRAFMKEHPVVHATCTRIGGIPDTPWWTSKTLSGGQMVEQTIHNVDIIRYMLGEAESVVSFASRGFIDGGSDYDTDDLSCALIKFKSGALASVMTGCYGESGASADNKITFSAKDARCDLRILDRLDLYGVEEKEEVASDEEGFVIKSDAGFKSVSGADQSIKEVVQAGLICDRTFIDAVITGDASKILSPYEDGLKSVALTVACNLSIDQGTVIHLDDLLR